MDISSLGQPLLEGGLLDTVSRFIGGDRGAANKTLSAAIPTTMYAIADRGSTEMGARSLYDGLKSGQAPQLELSQLGSVLGNAQASDQLMTASGGFLEKLLGGKLAGIVGGLSAFGGTDRDGTSKLVALAAPLALGILGKRVCDDKLDARGLAGFLGSQKSKLASMVPGPLRATLGLDTQPPEAPPIRETVARATPFPARREVEMRAPPRLGEPRRAGWPLLLLALAVAVGLGWMLTRVFKPVKHVATPAAPTRVETTLPAPRVETAIGDYLASGSTGPRRFALEGIDFANGSAALDADGQRVVSRLAQPLKAHPDAMATIEGFTDPSGDPTANLALARARADAVKQALVDDGVSASHLSSVAAGTTENRRVEIVVTPR